jgi:hypothetical protein
VEPGAALAHGPPVSSCSANSSIHARAICRELADLDTARLPCSQQLVEFVAANAQNLGGFLDRNEPAAVTAALRRRGRRAGSCSPCVAVTLRGAGQVSADLDVGD